MGAGEWIDEVFAKMNPMGFRMDGFDEAVVGCAWRCGMEPVLVYDRERVVRILMGQGMTEDDAVEFHEFNQAGAWVGPNTPLFFMRRGE